ncbi:MAG TPA: polyamine aminopropyltransferase [Chthoniobacterales bacterium]
MTDRAVRLLLLASVFAIATCGLVYELIAGTLASYLLGDSVTQFSTVIGVYLFAMGIGSWLSKYAVRNLLGVFIQIELLIGLFGGFSAAMLFVLFEHVTSFRVVLYATVVLIGTMVGLEIPLLLRILKDQLAFKDLVSKVFTFDYIGALLASLLFPLVLVPYLGLVRSSFLFGILNTLVGMATLWMLKAQIPWANGHRVSGFAILLLLTVGFAGSDKILAWSEAGYYPDTVIHAKSSPYQRIIITQAGGDLRLYLNGNLQFSERDEYRYHEALVHPGLSRARKRERVLVLGGGDGLAVREVLKYPDVREVTLVDLDAEMTRLFSNQEMLVRLNGGALKSPKVKIINTDAFTWLQQAKGQYDFIVADFPDPSNFSVGKLYTTAFYGQIRRVLARDGAMAVQSTSPYVARKSFWCVVTTLDAAGFATEPYHVYVPSFGEWGFVLASPKPLQPVAELPEGLRFLTSETLANLFRFPPDMEAVPADINRLNNQVLVRTFEEEWKHYVH